MQIISSTGSIDRIGFAPPKSKGGVGGSERSHIVKQIQELTGFLSKYQLKILLFQKLKHIPAGNEGLKLLKFLYSEAMTADTLEGKRIRFWMELKKTHENNREDLEK